MLKFRWFPTTVYVNAIDNRVACEKMDKNTSKNTAAYDRDIPFNRLIILKGLGEFRIRIRLGAPLRLASFLSRVGCGVELVN